MKKTLTFLVACVLVGAQTQKKATFQKSGESDLFVIRTQKGFSTLVEFPADQEILEVTCGDKEFWVIEGKGRFLHVKPAKEGSVTNLNVLLKGDVVYSFLLKEISRAANAKDGPDLRVVVNGGDELSKLRKEKDNLEEALSRSEHTVKDLSDKYDAVKTQASKKDDAPHAKDEQSPKGDSASTAPKPAPEAKPEADGTAPTAVATGSAKPLTSNSGPSEQPPIASSYVVERNDGFIRASGHLFARLFKKINSVIHVY